MDEQDVKPQNDEKDVAPKQEEAVQETEAQPQETSEEQPVEAAEENQSEEVVEEKAPTPEETDAGTLDYYQDYLSKSDAQKLPELTFAEDGTISADQLNAWAQGVSQNAQYQSAKQFAELREEDRQWNKVFDEYPEVRENKKLRDLVHKQRMGNIQAGGKNDVVKAARDILSLRSEALTEGKQNAQQSITRQKSANLETASTATDTSAATRRDEELQSLMHSRSKRVSEGARQELLRGMIERGEI